jgi:hypothetical protein
VCNIIYDTNVYILFDVHGSMHCNIKGKGKVTPLEARCGPEGG